MIAPSPRERQRGEWARPFHAFAHYRDLPTATRSIDRAFVQHCRECPHRPVGATRRSPKYWRQWSAFWDWVARAEAWDREVDRQARDQHVRAQAEARERHRRLAQGTLTVLSTPVSSVLASLQDPKVLQGLTDRIKSNPDALLQVLGVIAKCASAMTQVVEMERLASA